MKFKNISYLNNKQSSNIPRTNWKKNLHKHFKKFIYMANFMSDNKI